MNKDFKSDLTDEKWIKCQSKTRNGRFYLFNPLTGESRWNTVEANTSRVSDPSGSPIFDGIKSKTPAQDRLKRLQNALKRKHPQKSGTTMKNENLYVIPKIKKSPVTTLGMKLCGVGKPNCSGAQASSETKKIDEKKWTTCEETASTSNHFIKSKPTSSEGISESFNVEEIEKKCGTSLISIPCTKSVKLEIMPFQSDTTSSGMKNSKNSKLKFELGKRSKAINSNETKKDIPKGFLGRIKDFCQGLYNGDSRKRKISTDQSDEPVEKQNFMEGENTSTLMRPMLATPSINEEIEPKTNQSHMTKETIPIIGTAATSRCLIKSQRTANSRLKKLRESLKSNVQNIDKFPEKIKTESVEEFEPMDWQPSLEQATENNASSSNLSLNTKDDGTLSEYYDVVNENLLRLSAEKAKLTKWHKNYYYFVVDTNVFIEYLTFLDDLLSMKLCGTQGTNIYVPYCVLQELDKLKTRTRQESTKTRAVRAIKYLNKKLEEKCSNIDAQSAREERIHLINVSSPDDSILNCCLQVKQNISNIMLLSEDVNLRSKAICNGIPVSTKSDLTSKHLHLE